MNRSTAFLKFGFIVALCLASGIAFAVDTSVDFPIGQKNGSFNCTFDGAGTVRISSDGIKVRGFCAGDPNVTTAGQLQANSDDLKNYYFSIRKSATKSGKANVSALEGDIKGISCTADQSGKQAYPYGSKYC